MDVTVEYLKMCEMTEELQKNWIPAIGDYIGGSWYIDDQDNIGLTCMGIVQKLNPEGNKNLVDCGGSIFWAIDAHFLLFRQDQLQEIMKMECDDLIYELYEEWYIPENISNKFNSMEQLWLAFVMKNKFNKIWNGEEWLYEEKE